MKKDFLTVHLFVKFGYNFPNPDEFIKYICEKTDKMYLVDHLKAKFNHDYEIYGCHAVMNYFFVELDLDLQEALVDYALNVYAPQGMAMMHEEWKQL